MYNNFQQKPEASFQTHVYDAQNIVESILKSTANRWRNVQPWYIDLQPLQVPFQEHFLPRKLAVPQVGSNPGPLDH